MMVVVCPSCRSAIVFSERDKGMREGCPNCGQLVQLPTESMPEQELRELLSRLHRAGDTEPG